MENQFIDFNKIVPLPTELDNTKSPMSHITQKEYEEQEHKIANNELTEDEKRFGLSRCLTIELSIEYKRKFGADNWYDWNLHKYGTKWDVESLVSDSVKDDGLFECQFDTAWSPPSNFLSNLQNKFPKLDIKLIFELEGSDECGIFITDRSGDEVTLVYEQDEVTYIGSDGREIYYDNKDGEWHYHDDDEVCEDYMQVNPFYEN
jgi:hypothetical protein